MGVGDLVGIAKHHQKLRRIVGLPLGICVVRHDLAEKLDKSSSSSGELRVPGSKQTRTPSCIIRGVFFAL
jgi:hypothetical protein